MCSENVPNVCYNFLTPSSQWPGMSVLPGQHGSRKGQTCWALRVAWTCSEGWGIFEPQGFLERGEGRLSCRECPGGPALLSIAAWGAEEAKRLQAPLWPLHVPGIASCFTGSCGQSQGCPTPVLWVLFCWSSFLMGLYGWDLL